MNLESDLPALARAWQLTDEMVQDEHGAPCGDFQALRPSISAAVPLLMDRMRKGVLDKVGKSAVSAAIFKAAFAIKRRLYLAGRSAWLLDQVRLFALCPRAFFSAFGGLDTRQLFLAFFVSFCGPTCYLVDIFSLHKRKKMPFLYRSQPLTSGSFAPKTTKHIILVEDYCIRDIFLVMFLEYG